MTLPSYTISIVSCFCRAAKATEEHATSNKDVFYRNVRGRVARVFQRSLCIVLIGKNFINFTENSLLFFASRCSFRNKRRRFAHIDIILTHNKFKQPVVVRKSAGKNRSRRKHHYQGKIRLTFALNEI